MKKKFLALALLLGGAVFSGAQENYTTWTQHRTLVLNTGASGGNVAGNVLNFPMLIRLGAADSAVFTQSLAGGADLRFSKLDNTTHLSYQIESWNSTTRSAAIWVKMDTVKGNATTLLRMHWGKTGSADSSRGPAVFDTANGYVAVWHFNETPGTPMVDATGKGNTATPSGASASFPTDTAGLIGSAKFFTKASQQFYSIANGGANIALNSDNGPYTITAWVNPGPTCGVSSGTNNDNRITVLSKYGAVGAANSEYAIQGVGTTWRLQNTPASLAAGNNSEYFADKTCDANTWQLLESQYYSDVAPTANTAGANKMQVRRDNGDSTLGGPGAGRNGTGSPVYIGKMSDNYRFMSGAIDQIVISKVLRSKDWKKLVYESQKAAQTVVSTLTAPMGLDYSSDTAAYALGVLITPNVATVTGLVDSFTVAPALPTGLSLNKSTGAITGTPTVVTAAANYVLTAINGLGNAKDTLRLSVVAAPPIINYASSASFLAGAAIAPISPVFTSSVDSFTVAPALPAGLSLNKTTGAISGTPAAASAAASFVITGTNASGTGKDTISITVVASEDYAAGWNRHKTLWLNTSNTGAAVAGPVTNFPVLVRFTTTDTVYSQMLSGTADLRFTKANGTTRLPHQVEQWDSAGKSASVWVLVDTVLGNSGSQSIRMHWGRAAAQNLSVGRSVFDTAKGFRAVFHFAEAGDTAFDATQYGFKASPQRTSNTNYNYPTDTAGAIGRGRVFGTGSGASTTSNAAGNYYVVAGSAAPLTFPEGGPFTLSTWVISNATGTSRTFVSKSDRAYSLEFRNTGADWEFAEHNVTAGGWVVSGSPAATAGIGGVTTVAVWTHVMGVRTATASVLYVNGVVQTQATRTDATTTAHITTTDLNIGRSPDGGTNNAARYYWRGLLDEVRVASAARSADWARLEYENQKAAQTLVSQTQPVGIAQGGVNAQVADARLTAKALNGGMVFQVAGAPQGGKIALMDLYGRTIWNGAFPAGKNQVIWNGIAGNGQAVSGGVYLARVTLPGSAGTLEIKVPFAP